MAHVREQIRDAIAALLIDLPTTGERVEIGRARPLGNDYEPTLFIFTTDDTLKSRSMSKPRTERRSLIVRIEGRVIQPDVPDDALDKIATEVTAKMATQQKLKASNGRYLNIDMLPQKTVAKTQALGDQHEGAVGIEYLVTYAIKENAPEVPA